MLGEGDVGKVSSDASSSPVRGDGTEATQLALQVGARWFWALWWDHEMEMAEK